MLEILEELGCESKIGEPGAGVSGLGRSSSLQNPRRL